MEKTSATSGNSKEKEYENNEPPQVEDDHQWLLTGPEYSSDEAGDGTVIDPDPQWLQMGPEFSSDISADLLVPLLSPNLNQMNLIFET